MPSYRKTSQESVKKVDKQNQSLKDLVEAKWSETRSILLHAAETADENQRVVQQRLVESQQNILRVENLVEETGAHVEVSKSLVEQVNKNLDM